MVAEFTKAEKLEEALKVRGEIKELLAEKATVPEPAQKPKPEEKPALAPKNGKYRFVFDDTVVFSQKYLPPLVVPDSTDTLSFDCCSGWGFLLELQDNTLWIHGDVNPNKPNGIAVWPQGPRAMPCRVVDGKVLVDDGDPKNNKWRCVITWDVKSRLATHMFDDYKGKSFQKRGKITASSW